VIGHIVLTDNLGELCGSEAIDLAWTSKGTVLIDAERHVPIRAKDSRPDREMRFSDYVSLGQGRYAPTRVRLRGKKTNSDWRFRLHEPGLWLFDRGSSRQGLIGMLLRHAKASVRNVSVNGQAAHR